MDISRKVLYNIVMMKQRRAFCVSAVLMINTERNDDE